MMKRRLQSLPACFTFLTVCFFFFLLLLLTAPRRIQAQTVISFDRASVNVMKGKSRQLGIRCKDKYTVRSTDTSIATVTHSGLVKGKKPGDCEIVVKSGDESATIPVHVLRSLRSKSGEFLFMGHRGYQDQYPENTIPSFQGALDYGADGVEFDVWCTKSQDLLVFHDATLNRMCKKNGSIRSLTESSRRKYKVTRRGKKASIPTLEETLRFLKQNDAWAFIHLKYHGGPEYFGERADLVADCVRETGMTEKSVVFCSSGSTVSFFKKNHPDIALGFFYGGSSAAQARSYMSKAKRWGADWFYLYQKAPITYQNVKFAHELGLKIGLYQTTTKKQILDLLDFGADFSMMYHKLI